MKYNTIEYAIHDIFKLYSEISTPIKENLQL